MITELEIDNLGVIEHSTVEFGPGFTAFTGETGAGKTMIVNGLGLLLGGRADGSVVRTGAERASVTGRFDTLGESIMKAVDAVGGELDEGELIIARRVGGGRSRCWLGGAQATAAATAQVAEGLITIHGQSGQLRLARADYQRDLLDRSAGADLAAVLRDYRAGFAELRRLRAELRELTERASERAREAELLRFGLEEIGALQPQPGEDVALTAESDRLQSVDDLRSAAQQALAALAGDASAAESTDALTSVGIARKALERAAEYDASARPQVEQAVEAATLLADLAAGVSSYLDSLDADPARLEWIMNRRADLGRLTRKYGDTVDAVLAWSERAVVRLREVDGGAERTGELRGVIEASTRALEELADSITLRRREAAARLAGLIEGELAALAMPHARLVFDVAPEDELGPHGRDQVGILFAANPGGRLAPLAKVASGGELSRVRLALEVVLAGAGSGETFVFDEVDAGVGGQVAVEIGRRLARLATGCQVIVVTHLAQVAAFADTHYVVEKSSDGQVSTSSGVRRVQADERAAELARMMAGLETTDSALAHARELLVEADRA